MKIFAVAILVCSCASAADRVLVVDNSESTSIKDVVKEAVQSFDSENLDSYESCFSMAKRAVIRRRVAYIFAENECSMELIDIHIVCDDGQKASAAVKYKLGNPHESFVVLSEIRFVKEEGSWFIDGEVIRSKDAVPPNNHLASPGEVPAKRDALWNPMRPDPEKISPELQHLIGDVSIQQGIGCDGGRCANGRCPVR